MGSAVHEFELPAAVDQVADLQQRLANTRWPDRETVDDWNQGIPLATVRALAAYWADTYDWTKRVAHLNRLDHYRTTIDTGVGDDAYDGEPLDIHFVHQRSPHPDAVPLIITHGWPGSTVEFDRVIEPLVDPTAFGGRPEEAFHVVAPSLPGFGFSGKPTRPGVGVERIARMWAELMARLGYDRYLAQGGDWGSSVTAHLAATDPGHCAGAHMTLAMQAGPRGEVTSDEGRLALERIGFYMEWDSGYSTQQKTRPQTVAYGLADSPVGQLAWIVEKFAAWSDLDPNEGSLFDVLDRDLVLDNVMFYWLNDAAGSSARIYWESFGRGSRPVVTVPTGFTVYPAEIVPPVRDWLGELFPNIVYWHQQPRGGHFAAFEQPDLFVNDLRSFRREVWP